MFSLHIGHLPDPNSRTPNSSTHTPWAAQLHVVPLGLQLPLPKVLTGTYVLSTRTYYPCISTPRALPSQPYEADAHGPLDGITHS